MLFRSIIFLFLTQYKFKIFFFLFPPFTCHSTATHHVWNLWINASTLSFFIYLFYFPQASIFIETHYAWNLWISGSTLPFIYLFILFLQGFHFLRFNLHHTFKKNLCTKSAFNFDIFFPSFFLTFISSVTPTSQNML